MIVSVCSFRAEENHAILGIEQKRFELASRVAAWRKDRSEPFSYSVPATQACARFQSLLVDAQHLKEEGESFKDFATSFKVFLPSRFYTNFVKSSERTVESIEAIDVRFLNLMHRFTHQLAEETSDSFPFITIDVTYQTRAAHAYSRNLSQEARTFDASKDGEMLHLIVEIYLQNLIRAKYPKGATQAQLQAFSYPSKVANEDLINVALQFFAHYCDRTSA